MELKKPNKLKEVKQTERGKKFCHKLETHRLEMSKANPLNHTDYHPEIIKRHINRHIDK